MRPCKKKAFRDKQEADWVVHRIKNKDDGRKKPQRAYECTRCNKWHITSEVLKTEGYYLPLLDWSKIITNGDQPTAAISEVLRP